MNNINSTPQRAQQKRRQRHTTISGDNNTPGSTRPQQAQQAVQRRTPQSQPRSGGQFFNNSNKLQRQHSVTCCTPPNTGKLTPPRFLRLQKATNGTGSQNSLFAGSKFMDSPAPENIPMPPAHWFSGSDLNRRVGSSPTPSSVSDSLSSASASSFEASSGDEFLSVGYASSPGGFRLNPLQLIAAVSAVA